MIMPRCPQIGPHTRQKASLMPEELEREYHANDGSCVFRAANSLHARGCEALRFLSQLNSPSDTLCFQYHVALGGRRIAVQIAYIAGGTVEGQQRQSQVRTTLQVLLAVI